MSFEMPLKVLQSLNNANITLQNNGKQNITKQWKNRIRKIKYVILRNENKGKMVKTGEKW